MMTMDHEIARCWIELQRATKDSHEYEENFWALEKLMELCDMEPSRGFTVIQEIMRLDSTDAILAGVAAGPMVDLLVQHGPTVIARVEERAAADSTFRKMLGAVWKNSMADDIWDRVERVAGPTF